MATLLRLPNLEYVKVEDRVLGYPFQERAMPIV